MHNERSTSGSEGECQKPAVVTSRGADARPYRTFLAELMAGVI